MLREQTFRVQARTDNYHHVVLDVNKARAKWDCVNRLY